MESKVSKERDSILTLKKEQADIAQNLDLLKREQKQLLDSNLDIRTRLLQGEGDIDEVEKKHLVSIQVYEERNIALLDEIISRQDSLKVLLNSSSNVEANLSNLESKCIKKNDELVKTEKQFKCAIERGIDETRRIDLELRAIQEELAKTKRELDKAQIENITIRNNTQERIKSVEKEERLLSIRRSDLEIYEMRLKKQYPTVNLVLTPV